MILTINDSLIEFTYLRPRLTNIHNLYFIKTLTFMKS